MKTEKINAIYLRLSKEDGQGQRESNSIANQRKLIYAFIQDKLDIPEDEIVEFVDDGYSGTNFNRPAIKRLLAMVGERRVKTIIVKDLSRFGRDHIEIGDYLEHIFPFLRIRFIAVNDKLDSNDYMYHLPGADVAYKNLLNELTSTLLSDNTRKSIYMKRKTGECINAAPYGYRKKAGKGNGLLINQETGAIVQEIFSLRLQGKSKHEIAKIMNQRGMLTPGDYRKNKNGKMIDKNNRHYWTAATVGYILKNEEYTGVAISGQYRRPEIGKPYSIKLLEEQWERYENAHPVLVTKEVFFRVNDGKEDSPFLQLKDQYTQGLFTGFLCCGHCGHNLRKQSREIYGTTYSCRYKNLGVDLGCHEGVFYEEKLKEIIFPVMKQQVQLLYDAHEMFEYERKTRKKGMISYRAEKREKQVLVEKLKGSKFELYQQWKNGNLSQEEYHHERDLVDDRMTEITYELQRLEEILMNEDLDEQTRGMISFVQYKDADSLTHDMLESLVEKIRIWDLQHISIEFRYQDCLVELLE